mmetsp:Transcript_104832/g.313181  ORF Transcript_104832/g.313181 Transcript_104832/m.313181 type:complete len:447 (-) Transcript_104832:75-1415(-)
MGQFCGATQFAGGAPAPAADAGSKPLARLAPPPANSAAPAGRKVGRAGAGTALTLAAFAAVAAAAARRAGAKRHSGWLSRRWRRAQRRSPALVATATSATSIAGEAGSPARGLSAQSWWPQLLLVIVAALYGSLGICLRGLYSLRGPPTPAALSLVRQFLTVLVFIPLLSWGGSNGKKPGTAAAALPAGFWGASLELATWNLGTQGLLNAGLALTGAARASFFTQLSVVITPIFARLAGQRVPPVVWGGCAAALAGVLFLGADGSDGGGNPLEMLLSGFNMGDIMCLASAATWSAYIFRLGILSRRSLPSVPLQAAKTAFLCVLYFGWVLVDWLFFRQCSLLELWPGFAAPAAWAILLFSAIGPGALGDVWMQHASDRVSAATANVLLAMESLFAAGFAAVLLGERLGGRGLVGAVLIFAAVVVVGSSDRGGEAASDEASNGKPRG